MENLNNDLKRNKGETDISRPYRAKKSRWWQVIAASAVLLLVSILTAALFGTAGPIGPASTKVIGFTNVLSEIGSNILQMLGIIPHQEDTVAKIIVWDIRMPRILMGALVGMALAVSGVIMQALFKNPMADPFILGLASGASTGATLAIILGGFLGFLLGYAIPVFAFVGATITITAVYYISRVRGKVQSDTLLLSGIAVGSLMSALTSLLTYISGEHLRPVIFWLMGGLVMVEGDWDSVFLAGIIILPVVIISVLLSNQLNVLLLGDESAQYRGLDVERMQKISLLLASLMTGIAVAFSGVIGFVGLIIPHLIRMVTGPDHRILMPVSAVTGAAFLVIADVLAKTIIYPTELPVGIITAICGTPFFLYLLRKRKKTGWWAG